MFEIFFFIIQSINIKDIIICVINIFFVIQSINIKNIIIYAINIIIIIIISERIHIKI
jgi:hypothetical protein